MTAYMPLRFGGVVLLRLVLLRLHAGARHRAGAGHARLGGGARQTDGGCRGTGGDCATSGTRRRGGGRCGAHRRASACTGSPLRKRRRSSRTASAVG